MRQIPEILTSEYMRFGIWIIMALMLVMAVIMAGIAIYRYRQRSFRMQEMLLMIIVPFYQLVLMGFFFAACNSAALSVLCFGFMLLFFGCGVDVVLLHSIEQMEQKRQLEERLSALYAQRQLELEYYQVHHGTAQKMQQVKAYLLEQIEEAEKLLEEKKDLYQIKEVLQDADWNMRRAKLYRYCENPLVNSILTIKSRAAQEKGISTDFRVWLDREIDIDSIDLCSLFCNLIDNALEACDRIEGGYPPKRVTVKAEMRAGCLILQVQNTYIRGVNVQEWNEEHRLPETSKKQKEEHGLGLKLVERTVEKYDGEFYLDFAQNIATVDVILNCAGQLQTNTAGIPEYC